MGEANWNQLNALRSWRAISPEVEILIFGASEGAETAAKEVNAVRIHDIVLSPTGAPSFNSMVDYTKVHGKFDLQVYVNADIILNHSIVSAIQEIAHHYKEFLLVGERLDLVQGVNLDTRNSNWIDGIEDLVKSHQLIIHGPGGVDYFGFKRGMWMDLPPVFMGRARCDQALLNYCFTHRIPIIDSTLRVVALHQFHDYLHLAGGIEQVRNGIEYTHMSQVHSLKHSVPTITDADFRITEDNRIIPNKIRRSFLRRVELFSRYRLGFKNLSLFFRILQYYGGKRTISGQRLIGEDVVEAWRRIYSSVLTAKETQGE
jgi:hypothetical protein